MIFPNRKHLPFLLLAFILGALLGYFLGFDIGYEKAVNTTIDSFEECAAAGYPIMESYPEQCMTPDGRSFTRDISNDDNQVACTLDAKMCPDGSAVGRVPPTCEFAPCPGE
jgi:hypothetical protein